MFREAVAAVALPLFALSPALGQDTTTHSRKSEGAALAWSLAGTALPLAAGALLSGSEPIQDAGSPAAVLLITGGVIGPSLGHFYAARPIRGAATLALRAALLAAGLAAGTNQSSDVGLPSSAEAFCFFAGAVVAVVDIITAPASARTYNTRWRLSLVPVRLAPRPSLGVSVAISF